MSDILHHIEDGVLTLTLNRVAKKNSLTAAMYAELADRLQAAHTDKAVRVARYAERVREEVEIIAHACGLANAGEFRSHHVTAIERGIAGFRNVAE